MSVHCCEAAVIFLGYAQGRCFRDKGTRLVREKKVTGQLTPAEFDAAVRTGTVFPVVLLTGPEDYLRQRAADNYLDKFLTPESREFDFTYLAGESTRGPELRHALAELPMLGSFRLLLLDRPTEMTSESASVLKDYLKKPNPALRILMADSENKPRNSSLKELLKSVLWIHYKPLNDNERAHWSIRYLKALDKEISDEAAGYLVQTSKKSLVDLAAKLDHAALFVGEARDVDMFTIQRISGVTSEVTVYQLEDALHRKSLADCLRFARSLLEGGEPVLRLINYLHRSLFRLWQIKVLERRRGNHEKSIKEILGNQFWKSEAFIRGAKVMSFAALERGLRGLMDLEITLKTRTVQGDVLFYHWLWEVMAGERDKLEPGTGLGS